MSYYYDFKKGDVLKIYYFQTINKLRKMFFFVGLCINKNSSSFTIQNFYGPEFVKLNFPLFAPNLISIEKLFSYNFSFRLSKLFHVKKLKLKSKTDKFLIKLPKHLLDPTLHIYQSKILKTKEKKRLRNKFRI